MIRDQQLKIRSAGSALDWDLGENKNRQPPPQKSTYSHNALQGCDQEPKKGGSLNALQGHNRDTEKGGEGKSQYPCLFSQCRGDPHPTFKCTTFIVPTLRGDALKQAWEQGICIRCLSCSIKSDPKHSCSGEFSFFDRKIQKYKKTSSDCRGLHEYKGIRIHYAICLICKRAKQEGPPPKFSAGPPKGVKKEGVRGREPNKGRGRGKGLSHNQLTGHDHIPEEICGEPFYEEDGKDGQYDGEDEYDSHPEDEPPFSDPCEGPELYHNNIIGYNGQNADNPIWDPQVEDDQADGEGESFIHGALFY